MVYRPEFAIDNEVLTLVSEIAMLISRIPEGNVNSVQLRLRHSNNVRTIHSTSAIEGNRLSLEEVTDIIDGKHVIGDPDDIREIKNAKKAYDRMNRYDPFSVKDLLAAHGTLMKDLVERPGEFRDCEVGVFKGPVAVHIPPEHDDVPDMVGDLMEWSKGVKLHPLVMSCIFHGRFEYIHPFVDGNGRMGRLWHSLILSKWRPAFEYLPIESWININKKEYYRSLDEAHRGNISVFVKFMLLMIRMAVDEYVDEITYTSGKGPDIRMSILDMVSGDPKVTVAKMASVLNVSGRTIKRHLSLMTKAGTIKREGGARTGHWEVVRPPPQ